jgi:aspartate carbamoyltransferase catalytic subunit
VGVESWPVQVSYAIDEVLPEVDAVMMLRVQSERMQNSFFPSTREYSRLFGLNLDRMNLLQKGALILHPGPMNRGLEISAECADGVQSVILEQVANGVSVRMAVLYLLLGGNIGVGS